MADRGPKIPRAGFSEKKPPDFLKFIGPVTALWVLQPSQTMHMVSTEPLIARAVFTKSIKVPGWQPGAPKPLEHDFPEKKRPDFLKFIGLVKPLCVLYPSGIMYRGSTGSLLVRAMFARSIKVHGLQPGAPKSREHDFPKKKRPFFEIHRTSDSSVGSAALPNHAYGLYGTFTNKSSVYKAN